MEASKKNIKLLVFLGGVTLILLVVTTWLPRSSTDSNIKEPHPENTQGNQSIDSKRSTSRNSSTATKPNPQLELARAKRSIVAWNEKDKLWAQKRSPKIVIDQSGGQSRGSIVVNGKLADLGENPPQYILQLDTVTGPLLFGRYGDRKNIVRTISHISIKEGDVGVTHDLQIRIPKLLEPNGYGFVFDRHASEIEKLGVIIPFTEVPENINPYDYKVNLRYNGNSYVYDNSSVRDLPEVLLDKGKVVLLGPESMASDKVRVVWLEMNSENGISIINEY